MKKIHRYLGVCLSLIMLVISITGVMLVWKREFLWVTIPEARELRAQDRRFESGLSSGEDSLIDGTEIDGIEDSLQESILATAARNIQASYPKGEVLFARFYSEGLSIHKVYLSDRRYAWHDQHGLAVQTWSGNERFEDWLLDLHHRLLLGNTVGLNAVGFTGLLLLPLMLLGLLIWWPWRKSYRFNFVPNSGKAGHVKKSHFETGVAMFLPASVIAITGVILVYPSESRWVLRDGFSEPSPPNIEILERTLNSHNANSNTANSGSDLSAAFAFTQQQFPQAQLRWLSYPKEGEQEFTIGVQEHDSWNRMGNTQLRFDHTSLVNVQRQGEQRLVSQAMDYTYPIHVGKFPTLYRLLLSSMGILLAWLSFLGLLSFFKRRG